MEFINYTPFPALSYVTMDCNDDEYHTTVMRATLEIKTDGTLAYAKDQMPVAVTDEYHGEPNQSSVRQESDLAAYKPKCDVIVNATAYAPKGKPAERFTAGIRIYGAPQGRTVPNRTHDLNQKNPYLPGELIRDKLLIINGPRLWRRGFFGGWKLAESKPIISLPIRYEHAYGGQNRIEIDNPNAKHVPEKHRLTPEQRAAHPDGPEKAPVAHTVCETNPVGRGYAEPWYLKAENWGDYHAPLIESPGDPVREFSKGYAPQGLGIISRSWQPRLKLAGTYDEAWLNERHPYLPEDFDFAYWNCAHPDLQLPYLNGDEVIELVNLCPHNTPGNAKDRNGNTIMRFQLPKSRIRLTLESESGKFAVVNMALDTLIIEPDERRVSIVWRRVIPFSAEIAVAEAQVRTVQQEEDADDE